MVKMKKNNCDLVIICGGVAGLTLAKILSDKGVDVHLVEPYAPKPFKSTEASGGFAFFLHAPHDVFQHNNGIINHQTNGKHKRQQR